MGNLNYRLKLIARPLVILINFLTIAIFLTINNVFLFIFSIKTMNIVAATGVSDSHMQQDYFRIINFLQNPFIDDLKFKYFNSSYNGIRHFHDVKQLVMFNNLVLAITLPFCFIIIRKLFKQKLLWELLTPIKVAITVLIGIIFLLIVNFDQVFIWFHEIFFRNNYWIFDPQLDPIINMLPDSFFAVCFGFCILVFLIEIMILYIAGRKQLKNTYRIK